MSIYSDYTVKDEVIDEFQTRYARILDQAKSALNSARIGFTVI
jgi:hypothetical protein